MIIRWLGPPALFSSLLCTALQPAILHHVCPPFESYLYWGESNHVHSWNIICGFLHTYLERDWSPIFTIKLTVHSAPTEGVMHLFDQNWWFWLIFWAKWDGLDLTRCQKPPQICLTPRGDRGASKRGVAEGPVFLKSAFLVFLVIFLQTWADIDVRTQGRPWVIPWESDSKF